ncbi:MAG TPA: SpoIID/LytB domain-containing protein [Elusimicrobiales bacterium]|nr:SpoIID/LytB domain-containing protein [Elusimicrobiales bacterium]
MKSKILPLFCAAALSAGAPAGAQEDLSRVYSGAVAQWLDGRPEDAAGALKYVAYRSSDAALAGAAMKDLAVLLAEAGKNSEALPYLAKAEILNPQDFYLQFEKGWNLLSLEKYQDARAAFERSLSLTADQGLTSQAGFGIALAEAKLKGPKPALERMQAVYTQYPYLLSPTAQLISFYLEKTKRRQDALNFIKDSLGYDPRNIQAEIELARLYDEMGFSMAAWQTYYTLYDLDAAEKTFAEKTRQLLKHIKGKTDDLLYWTRLSWPAHTNPVEQGSGPKVKLGLYADKSGVPAPLKSFNFIAASDFEIIDARMGLLVAGKSRTQWSVAYNELNRLYEIRDSRGSVARNTGNNLRIVAKTPGGVILIKNPELMPEAHGVNRSDKEVAGELQVLLREKGFWLINETPVEPLVSPTSASLANRVKLPEFLKALAVTVRTRLTYLAFNAVHESREYNLCDSAHCLAFPGLQAENEVSAQTARATRGELLETAGAAAPAAFHRACGGFTRGGVNDSGRPAAPPTPFSLYARGVEGPPAALMCLAEDKTESSDVTWTLLLRPKWIESRLNRSHKVGYLRALIPLAREADGRIKALRAEGTAGTAVIEGPDAVSEILTAGTLRSSLFSIRPIYDGKLPEFFMLRGIGTGDAEGLCLLGARGMALKQNSGYLDILGRYFPSYKVRGPAPGAKKSR